MVSPNASTGRARQRLARAHRQVAAGQRAGHGLLALCQRRRQADPSDRRAARGGQSRLDFDGGITALTGAADIGQGSSTMVAIAVAETLGHLARPHPRRSPPTPRSRPRTTAPIPRASPSWSATRRSTRPRSSRRCWLPPRPASSKRDPKISKCAGEAFRVGSGDQSTLPFADVVAAALVDRGAITVNGTFTCPPEVARRQAPRRRRRLDHGLQLRRPGRRGQRRRGDRDGERRQGLDRARLRPRHQSAGGRRTDSRVGLDGDGPGAVRGNPLPRWPAGARKFSRISHADHRGIPADRGADRGKPRSVTDLSAPRRRAKARLAGFPPALVNAIANAIGIDLDELPVTPDRVMEALVQRRRQAKLANSSRAAS